MHDEYIPKNKRKKDSGGISGVSIRRFVVTYLFLMIAFYLLMVFVPLKKIIDVNGGYTRGVVAATSKVLSILNIPSTSSGSIIRFPSVALDVQFGCNGLEAMMIYAVAVVAFPATWKKRLAGLAAGFVVLQVMNVIRIAGLAYTGVHFPGLFDFVHIYIAQGIMIAAALGIFFVYLEYSNSHAERAA